MYIILPLNPTKFQLIIITSRMILNDARAGRPCASVALFTKILTIFVRFQLKNFVREILVPFTNVFVACPILRFHLRETLPSQRSQMALFSFKYNPNWKWTEVFTFGKYITDHISSISVKSLWSKSAWKLTSQSLHVCKNRSIKILTTNFHRKNLSYF